jgi:hypothetical protein
MRFKLDENLPIELAVLIRRSGHNAATVLDQGLGGAGDSELASLCAKEGRILVTFDTDFSDIRTYPPRASSESSFSDWRISPARTCWSTVTRLLDAVSDSLAQGEL